MKTKIIFILMIVALITGGLLLVDNSDREQAGERSATSSRHSYLRINDRCLQLAVSDTPQKRRQGLSNYDELADDQGMLFVYDQPGNYGFWMKDMEFAIDILWLTEDNQVVGLKENAQPSSYPQTFYPDSPAKKVIETVARFTKTENINSGDRLTVIGPTTTTPVGC